MFKTCRLASKRDWREFDQELRSRIGDLENDMPNALNRDAQLLGEFSPRCVVECLTLFQLTPRKFPQAAVPFVRRPLTNQISLFVHYNGCENPR
jgi:hypothetical protein